MASSVWDNFYKLSTLSIQFSSVSGASVATLYGNGNNQVAIAVQVKIVDKSGNSLPLTASDLQSLVYLCNYTDGSNLPSIWSVSDSSGDYSEPFSYGGSRDQDADPLATTTTVTVVKYISASALSSGQSVSAGINIPGVGAFDTSRNGTGTLNGPGGASGSIFKNADYLTVTAKQAIDLNNMANITVKNQTTEFEKIVGDLTVYHVKRSNGSATWNDGESYKTDFQIYLASGYSFKHKIVHIPSSYGSLFGGSVTFNGNKVPDIYCGLSRDSHYHVGMVSVEAQQYGVHHTNDFRCKVRPSNQYVTRNGLPVYRPTVGLKDARTQWLHIGTSDVRQRLTANISQDYIFVGYLELFFVEDYLTPVNKETGVTYWTEEPARDYAYVRMSDKYGNYGTLKLTFNPKTYPSIKVETYSGDSWKG